MSTEPTETAQDDEGGHFDGDGCTVYHVDDAPASEADDMFWENGIPYQVTAVWRVGEWLHLEAAELTVEDDEAAELIDG